MKITALQSWVWEAYGFKGWHHRHASTGLFKTDLTLVCHFSDGVLVAEVIKHMFPKLVDVHNYSPANSTQHKMQNWVLLNRKVFSKLQFDLSDEVIRQLATSKPGVMESVLSMLRTRLERVRWDVKGQQSVKARENERPEADQNTMVRFSGQRDVSTVAMSRGAAGGAVGMGYKGSKLPQDETVPLLLLEEKEQEVLAKNETIHILQAKVKRLEHLLHLKDIRIEDMQKRLESMRATGKR